MGDVVKRLEKIVKGMEISSRVDSNKYSSWKNLQRGAVVNPWAESSAVANALGTFAARLEDPRHRVKLEEFGKVAKSKLGSMAVDVVVGVFNPVRLYRFLCTNDMDVKDATSMLADVCSARDLFEADKKRKRIVEEDLSFCTIPRARKLQLEWWS